MAETQLEVLQDLRRHTRELNERITTLLPGMAGRLPTLLTEATGKAVLVELAVMEQQVRDLQAALVTALQNHLVWLIDIRDNGVSTNRRLGTLEGGIEAIRVLLAENIVADGPAGPESGG